MQIMISNEILDLVTGILAKISLGTGIWVKFRLGTGIWYPIHDPPHVPKNYCNIFSYNGIRDWLKIKWRDQSCMQLEVVAKNKHKKNTVTFRSFDLREYRDCLSEFL